jgi:hypothetical protein
MANYFFIVAEFKSYHLGKDSWCFYLSLSSINNNGNIVDVVQQKINDRGCYSLYYFVLHFTSHYVCRIVVLNILLCYDKKWGDVIVSYVSLKFEEMTYMLFCGNYPIQPCGNFAIYIHTKGNLATTNIFLCNYSSVMTIQDNSIF